MSFVASMVIHLLIYVAGFLTAVLLINRYRR